MDVDLPPICDMQSPIGQALFECEVHCVSACCGMDAFEISPDHLQRWADRVSRAIFDEVRCQIDQAIENLRDAPEVFYFLDRDHSRADVTAWFKEVHAAFAATRPPAV